MNILCIAHYYPPHVGGLEVVARKQAESLCRAGHEVTVVTCASDGLVGSMREGDVLVYRARALNIFDALFGIPFPLGGIGLVSRIFREVGKADLVHVHDVFYMTSWIAYAAALVQRKPIYLTQHVAIVNHPNALVMALQHLVYATFGALIFARARAIVVYNETVKNFLRSRSVDQDRIRQMRNGVDLATFHPADIDDKQMLRASFGLPDRPLVLFVGRLVPKKGFDALYRARHVDFDIVFAGSGSIPEGWESTPGMHFLGPVSQVRLADLYRACDVFVLPARGELFTLAMQEAMATGLPVVTTDEKEYAAYDIDRDGIALCEPVPTMLREHILRILSNPDQAARMSAYSLKLAQEWFDWEKNANELIDIYARATIEPKVTVTTSWDDGHVLDLKLASLLKKYAIAGTFYVSPRDREFPQSELLTDEQVKDLSAHFEIGAHTMTHPRLSQVDINLAREEIVESKKYLEDIVGKPIVSFCYPGGMYRKEHETLVRDAGMQRARTTRRFSLRLGSDPFAFPTTVHTYDHWSDLWDVLVLSRFNPLRFFKLYRRWDLQAVELFDRACRSGGVFHLWGHSWEVEANKDWDRLEGVLHYIGNRAQARYVSNMELV